MLTRLSVVCLLLAACGPSSPDAEPCITIGDCPRGQVCTNGLCLVPEDAGVDANDDANALCGMACDTGLPCEQGTYDCSDGEAVCIASGVQVAGTECRAAIGPCDLQDVCDGESRTCPDSKAPAGVSCEGGFCDGAGECGACDEGAPCSPSPCETGTTVCSEDGMPSCEPTGMVEDGFVCGEDVAVEWSACEFAATCSETGEQTRTVIRSRCEDGTCRALTAEETDTCERDTDGIECGGMSDDWSACMFI